MAEIIPFQGLRYNTDKVGGLELVTAPPYDVVSESERYALYEKSPYNIIHLTCGRDVPGEDKYERAAASLRDWIKNKILILDEENCIYIYEQDYLLESGLRKKRRGFIALLRLEEFENGIVLPHEATLATPRETRLRLLRACGGSLSPVLMLYEDPEQIIGSILVNGKLIIEFEGSSGESHRIWRITSSEKIAKLKEVMREKNVYLADGHHRYEAALAYQREMKGACNYIMAYLTDIAGDGLTILPVHRLLRISPLEVDKIEERASKFFTVIKVASLDGISSLLKKESQNHPIGFYSRERGFRVFLLKDKEILSEVFKQDYSMEWKTLDANILHELLLDSIKEEVIDYINSAEKGVDAVKKGKFSVAFFLNPVSPDQVKSIAESGEKMPGKATYFYPKLLDGLIMWQKGG